MDDSENMTSRIIPCQEESRDRIRISFILIITHFMDSCPFKVKKITHYSVSNIEKY